MAHEYGGINLYVRPANARRRYIGWAHTQNDLWIWGQFHKQGLSETTLTLGHEYVIAPVSTYVMQRFICVPIPSVA